MVVNSGVHSSLHANCNHQIVFAKSGITKKLMSVLLEAQLINLVGKELCKFKMLMSKSMFLIGLH